MNIKHIANMQSGQDGAVYGDHLFRFNSKGECKVYSLDKLKNAASEPCALDVISEFTLDRADEIVPHSNAVVFGNEFYAEGDEFPLLYSNIYNNYAKEEDKLCGVCCVYRLQRKGSEFFTTLVQLIEIGFTENKEYWRSDGESPDVRPYGNFVIDTEKSLYYAFVMRDADKKHGIFPSLFQSFRTVSLIKNSA